MARVTRRDCLQVSVGALTAAALAPGAALAAPLGVKAGAPNALELGGPLRQPPTGQARIQFAHVAGPGSPARLKQLKQIGVNYAIAGVSGALCKVRRDEYLPTLRRMQAEFAEQGITIAGVEGHPVPAEKIKLGLDGRDEEIENYQMGHRSARRKTASRDLLQLHGRAGLDRTRPVVQERGGALTSEFDPAAAKAQGLTQ